MNILILCTGNSARSILLESIFMRLGEGRVRAFSAGSMPVGAVHPEALALLRQKSYPCKGLRSKSWDEFATPDAPHMDMVITVCGNAKGESCPRWPGAPLRGHWGIGDPAQITGSPAATKAAFRVAFDVLEARAKAWLALDFERMDSDERQHHINRIGAASLVM